MLSGSDYQTSPLLMYLSRLNLLYGAGVKIESEGSEVVALNRQGGVDVPNLGGRQPGKKESIHIVQMRFKILAD